MKPARTTTALVGSALVALLAMSCDGVRRGAPEDSASDAVKVVVDTDMGADDVMALLFLLERPEVTVDAVTIAGDGLTHCDAGVRNARALLTMAGSPDVPVACVEGPRSPARTRSRRSGERTPTISRGSRTSRRRAERRTRGTLSTCSSSRSSRISRS
jgi:hypothetical protein